MAGVDDAAVDVYASLAAGSRRPTTDEEVAAAAELKARRDAWLKEEAAKRGYETPGALEKVLTKALRKREKQDNKKKKPQAPAPQKAAKPDQAVAKKEEETNEDDSGDGGVPLEETMRRILGAPKDNHGRGDYFVNSDEILQRHLETTGGKYRLRFPPEPNGYLHIGHAKAMSVNFGTAEANGGDCYLRFDDTNPEAEKQEYIDAIVDNVRWMGYTPFRITYTSDYFEDLYALACELIRRGKAYVCLLPAERVTAQRNALRTYHNEVAQNPDLPFPKDETFDEGRDVRSAEENLALFQKMREGRFGEGEATLRLKGDFMSKNPNMWDHMAYRVMFKEHHRTGDKWCIYPTYDFSHCLVDSIENVTHSLCTLEFETRQASDSSYHWLLDALGMFHPKTWESSRCSISCNVMSKRRLQRLVMEGHVNGWDDPRLLTLAGIRRRGYTSTAVRAFCRGLGVARSSNEVCVPVERLENAIRMELDTHAPRRFAVLEPVELVITNFEEADAPAQVTVPNHPAKGREDMGTREVPFTSSVYIPGEKFRLDMVKGYKGMVPGSAKNQSIKLLNARVVTYESHETDSATGAVKRVMVRLEPADTPYKGMPTIAWVPNSAARVEGRMYAKLFKDCDVDGVEVNAEKAAKEKGVDFIELFNPDSVRVTELMVEPGVVEELAAAMDKGDLVRYQFITLGYFCADAKDSTRECPVFNLIVSLKEDKSKANVK
ncbi:Glutamine--tRNA ligase [Hondaea fermentalgiana]|uniref:glutamine--tRNA ligase n=1 Tax=Hondaea fermentalgiana TaxID=2315210 RepID=A0A2R5H1D5_9STRA|nr:Glutamine--tRNA ligase [Hondaea fermentalgiana]|eukprot:GBG34893.1 Glutamine--tRNA ligase [Hondaea fermentalgiana]